MWGCKRGDHVKVEFCDAADGESESFWVKEITPTTSKRIVYGTLDNEPVVNNSLRLGTGPALAYDNGIGHMNASSFKKVAFRRLPVFGSIRRHAYEFRTSPACASLTISCTLRMGLVRWQSEARFEWRSSAILAVL